MMPHIAMTIAATLWASSFIASKAMMEVISPPQLTLLRFWIGALVILAVALLTRRVFNARAIGIRAFVTGFFEPGLITIIVYWGLLHTTAVHGVVLFALMPLVTSLLGRIFLGEAITRPVLGGAVIAVVGTVLLVAGTPENGDASLFGDAIVFLGMLLACVAILVLRRVAQTHGQPMAVTSFQLTGAGFCGFVVVGGLAFFNNDAGAFEAYTRIDTTGWLIMVYLGVLVSALAFFIYNFALGHIGVGRISLYLVLIAPLGVPLAAIFLGETVNLQDGVAIALVIVGVALPSLASQPWLVSLWPGRSGRRRMPR